ncbi:MAG: carboxypeptidase-like regulatory domain-containing protein, partial [Vicinamibacterales bacterium]
APTQETPVIGARIAIAGGSADQSTTSDSEGRFTLHVWPTAGQVLEISKDGHETAQVTLDDVTRANAVDVALKPTPGDISLTRSGDNDCVDLPPPPEGVPGLREYARIAVHNDGILRVNAAKLPFYNNPGYVYRQTDKGWEPNELDYILIRSPLPLLGGFVYVITFGGDKDLCGPWSIDATHPN